MRCAICQRGEEEIELYEGLSNQGIVAVCKSCSRMEGIPLIKTPDEEQIKDANKPLSVRERMEKLAGFQRRISKEQLTARKNLEKIRLPEKKQEHPDLIPNYYWEIRMARRRMKATPTQFSQELGMPEEALEQLEKGILPVNHEKYLRALEAKLNIKLFKKSALASLPQPQITTEKQILENVSRKMRGEPLVQEDIPREKIQQIFQSQAKPQSKPLELKPAIQPRIPAQANSSRPYTQNVQHHQQLKAQLASPLSLPAKETSITSIHSSNQQIGKPETKPEAKELTLRDVIEMKKQEQKALESQTAEDLLGDEVEIEEL